MNRKYDTSKLEPFDPAKAELGDVFVNEAGDVYTLYDNSVYCFAVSKNDNSKNICSSVMNRKMAEKKLFVMPKDANLDMSTE